jgi:hypothetical protein
MKRYDNGTGCGKIILIFVLMVILAVMAVREGKR